jgi:sulfoxide reductase heme-binding subunit YedZ
MSEQFWWYLARSSGIVAWLMLTAAVIWGIVLSTKAFPEHRRPAWLLDLHRWLGGLTLAFLAIHLGALVADNYLQFDLADLTIPFASEWEPGAVALGVIALWLLVAIELTSLAKRRLPKRVWRGIHLTSYAVFWLTSIHAALAGTDRTLWLYQVTAVASIAAVAWSLMYRLANRRQSRRQTAGHLHEREADATDRKRLPDPVAVGSDEVDPIDTFATVSGVGEPNGSVDS